MIYFLVLITPLILGSLYLSIILSSLHLSAEVQVAVSCLQCLLKGCGMRRIEIEASDQLHLFPCSISLMANKRQPLPYITLCLCK